MAEIDQDAKEDPVRLPVCCRLVPQNDYSCSRTLDKSKKGRRVSQIVCWDDN